MPLSTTPPLPEDYGDALSAAHTGDENAITAVQNFKAWCYQQPHGAAPFNQVYWDEWRKQQMAQRESDRLPPYFEIQWRVPAKNAMGSTAYWTPIRLNDDRLSTPDEKVAVDAYQQAQQHFTPGEVRLVKFTPEIISTL